jgi:hypothetical protein
MSDEIRLVGASKRERFIKLLDDGNMQINWEVYGDGDGGRDMETILVVSEAEFDAMKLRFGFSADIPILAAIAEISTSGRGDQFIKELFDGTIPLKEKFVY